MAKAYPPTLERLVASVSPEPNSGCWLWTASTRAGKWQYGVIRHNGKQQLAHRVSWCLHRGSIPDGMLVCHHCDNPCCVNPSHLFLGSTSDNMRDMVRKGRACNNGKSGEEHWSKKKPKSVLWGDGHPNSKIPLRLARVIRQRRMDGEATADLAAEYNVHPATIQRLVNGGRYSLTAIVPPDLRVARLPRGDAHPRSKLKMCDRLRIASDQRPSSLLALEYGVHFSTICRVRRQLSLIAQAKESEQ